MCHVEHTHAAVYSADLPILCAYIIPTPTFTTDPHCFGRPTKFHLAAFIRLFGFVAASGIKQLICMVPTKVSFGFPVSWRFSPFTW
jgi:hypothetical protein